MEDRTYGRFHGCAQRGKSFNSRVRTNRDRAVRTNRNNAYSDCAGNWFEIGRSPDRRVDISNVCSGRTVRGRNWKFLRNPVGGVGVSWYRMTHHFGILRTLIAVRGLLVNRDDRTAGSTQGDGLTRQSRSAATARWVAWRCWITASYTAVPTGATVTRARHGWRTNDGGGLWRRSLANARNRHRIRRLVALRSS